MLSVTALMIARDEERFIRQALGSLAAQEHSPSQVILVDDGSTDHTLNIMKEWASASPLNVLLASTDGLGRAAASNLGLSLLSDHADLVSIFDADDISVSPRISRAVHAFETLDIDWFGGQLQPINEHGAYLGKVTRYPLTPDGAQRMLARSRTPSAHAASTFRADIARQHGKEFYAARCTGMQDLELFSAFGAQWRIHNHKDVDVLYRRTSVDRSWRAWCAYRRWHHYAIAHGNARKQEQYDFPGMDAWWSGLSVRFQVRSLDPHEFLLGRYPGLRASASRLLPR